jgi:hypothetical protein
MLNEIKIFFKNVAAVRQLLKEGAGDNVIVDAINNHKYLYIYYDGDDNEAKGWRTIQPYRLGLLVTKTTDKQGNPIPNHNGELALRAWQDKGDSESFKYGDKDGRHRPNHEYWGVEPGWRLFLVDSISKVHPTGKRFIDDNGNVIIPPKYNESGDNVIPVAIASVTTAKTQQPLKTSGLGSVVEPDVLTRNAAVLSRKATKADIEGLWRKAKDVYKKSPNNFIVIMNPKGDFDLRLAGTKDRLKRNEKYVGDLTGLYYKFNKPPTTDPSADRFIEKVKQELQTQQVKENIKKIPTVRKTFFK